MQPHSPGILSEDFEHLKEILPDASDKQIIK